MICLAGGERLSPAISPHTRTAAIASSHLKERNPLMNQTIETIMKRRSVRLYEPKPIPRDILRMLINAGNMAPTGGNAQSWRFVAVEDGSFKKRLLFLGVPRHKNMDGKSPGGVGQYAQGNLFQFCH